MQVLHADFLKQELGNPLLGKKKISLVGLGRGREFNELAGNYT